MNNQYPLNNTRKITRRDRGSAIIELGLCIPLLIIIFVGVFSTGKLICQIWVSHAITETVNEGAENHSAYGVPKMKKVNSYLFSELNEDLQFWNMNPSYETATYNYNGGEDQSVDVVQVNLTANIKSFGKLFPSISIQRKRVAVQLNKNPQINQNLGGFYSSPEIKYNCSGELCESDCPTSAC